MNTQVCLPPYASSMVSRPSSIAANSQFNPMLTSNAHELSGGVRPFCGFSFQVGPVQGLPMASSSHLNNPKLIASAGCAFKGA